MRVTSASASTSSLVASAASRALWEPERSEPGMTRIFGDGIGFPIARAATGERLHQEAATPPRRGQAYPGHPRLACWAKAVDAGQKPGMTNSKDELEL